MNTIPYGYVYEIINKVNGKTYIGCRKLSLDRSWRQYMGSGVAIRSSINKYGKDNFIKSLLGYADSIDSLFELEMVYINERKDEGKGAEYNISSSIRSGGDTFSLLDEEYMVDIRRRQSEGVRRAYLEGRIERNSQWIKKDKEWDDFKNSRGGEIIDLYLSTGIIKKVSKELGFSRSRIREFLIESDIDLNHMNDPKSKRFPVTKSRLEEFYESQRVPENEKYKQKLKSFNCFHCGDEFQSRSNNAKYCNIECRRWGARKFKPEREELYELYMVENKTIQELMAIYKCSQRTVYNMLERHRIPRKNSTVANRK